MNHLDPSRLWEATQGSLELQVSRPTYITWLKDTIGVALDDQGLLVGTSSPFVSQWLEKRMSAMIETTLSHVADRPVRVRFQVIGERQAQGRTDLPTQPGQVAFAVADGGAVGPQPVSPAFTLNPRYTLDTFVVGESNQMAYAAAVAVSSKPGLAYNPLFLYGGVGLGKTHLLQAIGHSSVSKGLSCIYTSSEQFTNEFITSIQTRKTRDFRDKFRAVDVLLIDDIQFISGKDAIQEGFFHTFNELHNSNRQIVIASDRPTSALAPLEDRLRSRFEWGLSTDIQMPSLATRTAILQAKAAAIGFKVPHNVLELISCSFSYSIRDLEGALNRVNAYADLTSLPVTVDMAKHCLADLLISQHRPKPTAKTIVEEVCNYYDVEVPALLSKRRDRTLALPRQVAVYLLRELANSNLKEIANLLGGRDPSSVRYAWKRIATLQKTNPSLSRDLSEINSSLVA